MSFIGDYFIAWEIWKGLTKPQRKALKLPWAEHHPRTLASLTAKGLWDDDGPTRTGLAVVLCRTLGEPDA